MRRLRRAFLDIAAAEPRTLRGHRRAEDAKGRRRRHLVRRSRRASTRTGAPQAQARHEAARRSRNFRKATRFPARRILGTLRKHSIGHKAAEAAMLIAYRDGPPGPRVADQRRGGRSARRRSPGASRVSCSPIPIRTRACVREARDLQRRPKSASGAAPRGARPSGLCADPARVEGEPEAVCGRRSASTMSVARCRCSRCRPAFGGWRICIVDSAEDLNRNSANALAEDDRRAAATLAVPHRVASAGAGPADDPLALPAAQARSAVGLRHRRSRSRRSARPGAKPTRQRSLSAAGRANGSAREALARLAPESQGIDALIDSTIADLALSRPARGRQARRGAGGSRCRRGLPGVPS